MKQRNDLVKVKAKAGLVAVGTSTYHYMFPKGGEPVEVLRSHFAGPHFDAVRERLEVLEDPVVVRDVKPDPSSLPAGRATRRT
ncbi:hypothetical protein LCGC14_0782820 [marine sediment metagenome]|uniref:Uncharacterized protein n=1 Tax=marine sediment metagenome TaxID=412755 RepID=A0A0F9PZ79_9ZZZZ